MPTCLSHPPHRAWHWARVLALIVALVAVVATAVTVFPGGGRQSDLAPREFDTTGPETAIPVPDVTSIGNQHGEGGHVGE